MGPEQQRKMNRKLLKASILEWYRTSTGRAADKSELARILKIRPEGKAELRQILRELCEDGTLVEGKKGRFRLQGETGKGAGAASSLLTGKLSARAGGLFFVAGSGVSGNLPLMKSWGITAETLMPVDPARTATALGGDRVSAKPLS